MQIGSGKLSVLSDTVRAANNGGARRQSTRELRDFRSMSSALSVAKEGFTHLFSHSLQISYQHLCSKNDKIVRP